MDKLSTAKKQNIIYNLLDWTQLVGSQLIVIAISNTMDLPEKMLMARIESRIVSWILFSIFPSLFFQKKVDLSS